MPFGSQSAGDPPHRLRLHEQPRHRHQCLSAVSPLGTNVYSKIINRRDGSPMPFGSQSAGDQPFNWKLDFRVHSVTNAFRQSVRWGPANAARLATMETVVTNAFRQSVRWGPPEAYAAAMKGF